jgi:prevent-host-death family protein
MTETTFTEFKDHFPHYLEIATATESVLITRDGKPVGILIGFASEEDWRDYQLEHDPRFLQRIQSARHSLTVGQGRRIEDIE